MKRFITICTIACALCLLVTIGSSVIIDPYNVFHVENIRDNGVEPNKNYIKVSYLLDNKEIFDSLIVGSSHVGALHVEKITDGNCYNMTCPESLPCEELENLKSLLKGGYKPKRIYLGVDSWSYRGDPELHKTDKRTIAYEVLQNKYELLKHYVDPHNALFSLVTTVRHTEDPNFRQNFYEYGWMIGYDMVSEYDWDKISEYESGITNRLDETISEIEKYVELCEKEGIELILFINPYCAEEFKKDIQFNYEKFLRELAYIHPYYIFAGINEYTMNHDNFIDPSHYNAYLGDEILNVIVWNATYNRDDGWGMLVDETNVEDVLAHIIPSNNYY